MMKLKQGFKLPEWTVAKYAPMLHIQNESITDTIYLYQYQYKICYHYQNQHQYHN